MAVARISVEAVVAGLCDRNTLVSQTNVLPSSGADGSSRDSQFLKKGLSQRREKTFDLRIRKPLPRDTENFRLGLVSLYPVTRYRIWLQK